MTKLFRAYTRKSIVEGETASPARQRSAIERRVLAAYPDSRIEWYEDLDISGRFEANRPDWQRLLADLESAGGDGVAVESYDRSHRNVKEFLAFYDDVLVPAGRTLISATQNIDLSTADGRAMATVILAFAEMESRKASERMEAHLAHLRAGGRFHGRTPFACDRDPITKHLTPSQKSYLYNPATGEALPDSDAPPLPPTWERRYYHDALRALFEGYASGNYSLLDLAVQLNAAGWRTWGRDCKTPMEFQVHTTQSIISNWEMYAGRIPATPGQHPSGLRRPLTIRAGHPPILPIELCERIGTVLRARVSSGGRSPASFFMVGGLLYCGVCGVKLTGYAERSRTEIKTIRYYYRHIGAKASCPELRARAGDIHEAITRMLGELLDGKMIEEVVAELRRIGAERAAGEGGGEVREKEAEMERLISLHVKGLITEEEFTRHRGAIQAEIERLKPALYGQPMAEMEATISRLEWLRGHFRKGDLLMQKEVIRELFERIEVKDRKVSQVVLQPWAAGIFGVVRWLDLGPGVSWRLVELMV